MKEVWVIVHETDVVAGHGTTAEVCQLQGPNAYSVKELYPAFESEIQAKTFIQGQNLFAAKARKLEVW
jgi:hypothetical protein